VTLADGSGLADGAGEGYRGADADVVTGHVASRYRGARQVHASSTTSNAGCGVDRTALGDSQSIRVDSDATTASNEAPGPL